MPKFLAHTILLLLGLAPLAALADPAYSITFLPRGFLSSDMNNAGQVVGTTPGATGQWTAGIWSESGFTSLAGVAPQSWGYGINDRGEVVGTTYRGGNWHAFSYAGGTLRELDTSSFPRTPYDSSGRSINNAGTILGESSSQIGEDVHAFVYNNGQATIVNSFGGSFSFPRALSQTGYAVGEASTTFGPPLNEDFHAFLFKDGTVLDLGTLGGRRSSGMDVNDAGQVVGWASTALDGARPFLWQDGTMINLGTLGGNWGEAYSINNAGMVVGMSATSVLHEYHPFLYVNGEMLDLATVDTGGDGWVVAEATDINDRQQILGKACRAGVCETVLLNPVLAVPEPSMAALLLAGLAAAAVRRLRRPARRAGTPGAA